MQFGKLNIDPAKNPGILDTATWDPAAARQSVRQMDDGYWRQAVRAVAEGRSPATVEGLTPYAGAVAHQNGTCWFLASLADGQDIFLELGSGEPDGTLGKPEARQRLAAGEYVALHKTDAAVLDRFCRRLRPEKGPRALGATPRLGIGTRMTTAVWPGIFQAMQRKGFAANAIQNSIRELNLLDDLLQGRPPATNYACGFGTIETGYTGSTYEGLLVAGVLAALKSDTPLPYGADADHVQVKRGPDGLARAKRVLDAARYYSFYTLDLSDILHYEALAAPAGRAEAILAEALPNASERRDVLAYHKQPHRIGDREYCLDADSIGRFVGKHWEALNALEELSAHIAAYKEGQPFDLELTIDEHPPEVAAFDCLTTEKEMLFLLQEARRRGIPVTHIAPNVGVEKSWDYRCPDGLEGLERRTRALHRIAEALGVMLDFHSGDDLTSAPRRVLQRATDGHNHFKVSPMLQILYADVLQEFHPALFQRWWDDAIAYARREAEAGSTFAAECLRAYETSSDKTLSRRYRVFHHFSFAFVGRRDDQGRFRVRQEFCDLSPAFYRAYEVCIADYLCGLAEELF